MTGRRYLLRGQVVTVVTAFNGHTTDLPETPPWLTWVIPPKGPPRNVGLRYPDGYIEVRPFRGLRKIPDAPTESTAAQRTLW